MAPTKAMKPHEAFGIATLVIGGCFVLWSSTFRTQLTCDFDRTQMTITPMKEKHPSWALTALFGVGMIGVAAWQLKELGEGENDLKSTQNLLAQSNAVAFVPNQASSGLRTVMSELTLESPHQSFTDHTGAVYSQLETSDGYLQPTLDQVSQIDTKWFLRVVGYKAVQIFGGQGAGKSSLAEAVVKERVKQGHHAEVWDVHHDAEAWVGLPVYGGGMNYKAVDERMKWVHKLIESRYKEIELKGRANCNFQPVTIVVEELTNMATRCENSGEFYNTALSDIRKVCLFVLFISHDRTLMASGGGKGMAAARDASMLEVELFAESDAETGKEKPSFKGKMKLPGQAQQKIDIEIAPWMLVPRGFDYRSVMPRAQTLQVAGKAPEKTPESFTKAAEAVTDSEPASNPKTQTQQAFTASPTFTEPVPEKERFPSVTEILEVPQDKASSDSDESINGFYSLPEMSEEAEKVLFGVIWREMENGKSKSSIITETLGCKGRNYQKGQQWYDYLLNKYKP